MPPQDTNTAQDDSPQGIFSQVANRLKGANNILVTISTNPSVDQLAACIGLTLVLNKLGKHATAVFSGDIPSTIDFLKPEDTIEKNTDSLRDFIIALDKSKADKLRYKVEEQVVKIFITPYKTSISEKDLDYSQGDFNVDAVVALGVKEKGQLDSAILAHGRILHDATVISVNTSNDSQVGSINWVDERASSLCEMAADVARELSPDVFDKQNATALLTGIVAETDRYSNEKAAPHTMSIAGVLMSSGASTQLVSSKLDQDDKKDIPPLEEKKFDEEDENNGGEISIDHQNDAEPLPEPPPDLEQPPVEEEMPELPPEEPPTEPQNRVVTEPPQLGGQLTANTIAESEQYSGSTDPLTNMPEGAVLDRKDDAAVSADDGTASSWNQYIPTPKEEETLSEIEKSVDSPHIPDSKNTLSEIEASVDSPHLDSARNAVERAEGISASESDDQPPRKDLGSSPLGSDLKNNDLPPPSVPPPPVPPPLNPSDQS